MTGQPEQWGILARRSSDSQFGAATAWCSDGAGLLLYADREQAEAKARAYNERSVSPNVSYVAVRYS